MFNDAFESVSEADRWVRLPHAMGGNADRDNARRRIVEPRGYRLDETVSSGIQSSRFDVRRTEVFDRWLNGLRDRQARARILARIRRLTLGNPGDVGPVGEGVSEIMSSKTRTARWDAVDYLRDEADMAAYLEAVFEDGDASLIAAALGDIARAKGMTQIARKAGLGRESLYKALSPKGNPELATVLRVIEALGLKLQAVPAEHPAA